jgi:hypothetical protein
MDDFSFTYRRQRKHVQRFIDRFRYNAKRACTVESTVATLFFCFKTNDEFLWFRFRNNFARLQRWCNRESSFSTRCKCCPRYTTIRSFSFNSVNKNEQHNLLLSSRDDARLIGRSIDPLIAMTAAYSRAGRIAAAVAAVSGRHVRLSRFVRSLCHRFFNKTSIDRE